MKILMTLMGLDIGGAETHVVELSKQLVKLGHTVMIVSNGGAYSEEAEKAGIQQYYAPLNERKLSCMISSYFILKKIITEQQPDIVHAHARIPAFICGLIHKSIKFNFVTSAHGTFSVKYGLKFFTKWADYTLAVSQDIKQYLIDNYNISDENIIVSVNGVDTDRFAPTIDESVYTEFGLNRDAKRIIYTSRLNDDVCVPVIELLNFFEDIAITVPSVELVIIGEGNSYDYLKNKAAVINNKLGRNAVILTGARTDVNRIISVATLCIGVGRAILESMAMCKPVIVAGIEGYIGIFDHDKLNVSISTNFTCRGRLKADNSEYKKDVLTILNMSDDKRQELGAYGRSIVKNNYSLKKMVDDNLKLYELGMKVYKYDATILGYYGFKNSGDDALLHAMVNSLRTLKPDISLNVLSFNPKETMQIYGTDSTLRYDILKIYDAIKNSNVFILGGGSLIQDVTSTKSIIYYLWMVKRAKKMNKKVLLYANGIGPVTRDVNKRRVKRILNTVEYITLRDNDSAAELIKLGITLPKVEVTADPVFCIDEKNDAGADEILKQAGIDSFSKTACFSVRKWDGAPENFEALCANMADYISEKYGLLPMFIPMQYPYDASISRNIVSKMKTKGIFVCQRLDIPTTLSLVAKSRLVVSVRLHMLIYSTLLGIPAIGIAYDPKVSNFQKYINQPYFLDPRSLMSGDYKTLVDECMAREDEIKEQLAKSSEILKEKALQNATIAIALLDE